jgi:hypothetical protein
MPGSGAAYVELCDGGLRAQSWAGHVCVVPLEWGDLQDCSVAEGIARICSALMTNALAGGVLACRAKGNRLPPCGQARPNIKGGLDNRAIASLALRSRGGANVEVQKQASARGSTERRQRAGRDCRRYQRPSAW